MEIRVDLRSDTVTKPTPAMREAMISAEVGDDVIGNDPTVLALQQRIAEMLGKEAAIFVPSGTMSNQIAVRNHCLPGDEIFCETDCHIFRYEQAGYAQLAGVAVRTFAGDNGILTVDQLSNEINKDDDHLVRTKLVALENTHNRAGGVVQPHDTVKEICGWAREQGLKTHLDGARLFNAVIASEVGAETWAREFDSISVCFSKGLGAPLGSALVGSHDFVKQAKRARKLLGGGMRQVGFVAAAALFALENHIGRLSEDHANASCLAQAVQNAKNLSVPVAPQTNILLVEIDPQWKTSGEFVNALAEKGIAVFPFGPQVVRLVTHLDVDAEQIAYACEVLEHF